MTMFANCREKYEKDAYPNFYWEGNLDQIGKAEIYGYDFAVDVAKCFFCNIECIGSDFLARYLTKEELNQLEEILCDVEDKEDDEVAELIKDKPRIIKAIVATYIDQASYFECERNMYVTALRDLQESEMEEDADESKGEVPNNG